MADFELLNAEQTRPLFGALIDIYQEVFSQPPYLETLPDFMNFAGRLSYHAHQPGFRCVVACPPAHSLPVGYAYGYNGKAGSWFANLAAQRLTTRLRMDYLSDYFEFAELAVLPTWQGQGLGGRLHDLLLASATQPSACLATPEVETSALQLYLKRGWRPLAGGIELPGTSLHYQILGIRLKV